MRKYTSLKIVAGIFKVSGIIITILSLLMALFCSEGSGYSILIAIGIAISALLLLLIFLGISESINLMINIANDIQNTSENSNLLVKQKIHNTENP